MKNLFTAIQLNLINQTKPARVFWGVFSFLLVLMLSIVDYNTDVDLMVFYFVPIVTAAVLSHEYYAFILSILSAFAWTAAELFATSALASKVDYANQALARLSVVGVDMILKLAIFLLLTYGISLILYSRRRQEELTQFIVHDLRSPLTNVKTGLLTLEMVSGDQLDDTGKEMVNISLISADRLMWMINSLLDLPRLESKKLKLNPKLVLIDDIYNDALQQVALWSKQNHVDLQFSTTTQPLQVMADPAILTRVMVNLLSNALKYSPENSAVEIVAELLPNGSAQISVSDKGPGIDSEWAGKVFDKYTQMDARKAGAASSGLGLTFCRLAVKSMGGHIWIDSAVGEGTTVRFVLPVAK